jgi:hypothetical protein
MNWTHHLLANNGYQIVWSSGQYCRAMREGRDMLLRWTGEQWIVM